MFYLKSVVASKNIYRFA